MHDHTLIFHLLEANPQPLLLLRYSGGAAAPCWNAPLAALARQAPCADDLAPGFSLDEALRQADFTPLVERAAARAGLEGADPLWQDLRWPWKDGKTWSVQARVLFTDPPSGLALLALRCPGQAAEAASLSLEDQFKRFEKAKDEFIAHISHEMRTPMNAVLGMLHLVLHMDLTQEQRECMEKIETASRNLLHILNALLDFSKIRSGRMYLERGPFTLEEIVRAAAESARDKALKKDLSFDLALPSGKIPCLLGAPARLEQVLTALLDNAVKFTERGGVRLRLEMPHTDGGEAELRFAVEDTGIGIKPEDQENLFTSFRQADGSDTRQYGGLGLGLFLCGSMVRLMGGRIWCESALDRGSVFYFTVRCALAGDGDETGGALAPPGEPDVFDARPPELHPEAARETAMGGGPTDSGAIKPAAPSQADPPPLPSLRGAYADMETLGAHMRQDRDFYLEHFSSGGGGFAGLLAKVERYMRQGKMEEAHLLAHSLTGRLEALGAEEIRIAMEDYEHALHLYVHKPEKMGEFMRRAEEALADVDEDLPRLLDLFKLGAAQDTQTVDARILLDFLSELRGFAEEGRLIHCKKAMEWGKGLTWPAQCRKIFEEIDYALARYDFKKAVNLIEQLTLQIVA